MVICSGSDCCINLYYNCCHQSDFTSVKNSAFCRGYAFYGFFSIAQFSFCGSFHRGKRKILYNICRAYKFFCNLFNAWQNRKKDSTYCFSVYFSRFTQDFLSGYKTYNRCFIFFAGKMFYNVKKSKKNQKSTLFSLALSI